jgi:hypothetical protein
VFTDVSADAEPVGLLVTAGGQFGDVHWALHSDATAIGRWPALARGAKTRHSRMRREWVGRRD